MERFFPLRDVGDDEADALVWREGSDNFSSYSACDCEWGRRGQRRRPAIGAAIPATPEMGADGRNSSGFVDFARAGEFT